MPNPIGRPSKPVPALRSVDGLAFVEQKLADIAEKTAQGLQVAVAFDIDNTLFDTRSRTLEIGNEFDRERGTKYFAKKTFKHMGNTPEEVASKLKMGAADAASFKAFWFKRFFDGEYYQFDKPMPALLDIAERAEAVGAVVYFVTARAQSEEVYTIQQLQRAGAPLADEAQVISKPKMQDKTGPFKTDSVNALLEVCDEVSFFLTESRKDIRDMQKLGLETTAVLLQTKLSGEEQVDPLTPIWSFKV